MLFFMMNTHAVEKKAEIEKKEAEVEPKEGGAVSEVTGGPAEEMNQMPPCTDVSSEESVYDGSDLDKPESRKKAQSVKKRCC